MTTRNPMLLDWLRSPSGDTGVWNLVDSTWVFVSYEHLAGRTFRAAAVLVDAGLQPNERVAVLAGSIDNFLPAFYGVVLAGGAVTALSVPPLATGNEAFVNQAAERLRTGAHKYLLCSPELRDLADRVAARVNIRVVELSPDLTEIRATQNMVREPRDEVLLQFTSGSTALPKGVSISYDAVSWSAKACLDLIGAGPSDGLVSWLPFSHDMGLVGGVIAPTMVQSMAWHMSASDFIRRPRRWLECLGGMGASYAVVPPFGLELLLRRAKPSDLAGLDLRGVKSIIVGAERIDASLLLAIDELLAPIGLRPTALTPAYGLAEATLLVTGTERDRVAQSVSVDHRKLSAGSPVVLSAKSPVASAHSTPVVSCGYAVEGVSITIVDTSGKPLADGYLGEVAVSSPGLATGRVTSESGTTVWEALDSPYATGDTGFMLDGDLYIVGREGDSLKRKGATLHAEDLDVWLANVEVGGGSLTRLVAVLGVVDGVDVAMVVADSNFAMEPHVLAEKTKQYLGGVDVVIVRIRRSDLPRTTSGKPRRRVLWRSIIDRDTPTTVLFDEANILESPQRSA